jgi:hypothetical protein
VKCVEQQVILWKGSCIVRISGGPLAFVFMIQELIIGRQMACDFLGGKQGLEHFMSKWALVTLGPPSLPKCHLSSLPSIPLHPEERVSMFICIIGSAAFFLTLSSP